MTPNSSPRSMRPSGSQSKRVPVPNTCGLRTHAVVVSENARLITAMREAASPQHRQTDQHRDRGAHQPAAEERRGRGPSRGGW